MRAAIEARRIAGQRSAYALQEPLRRRLRTVVGKTAATFTAAPTTETQRVVLERDISAIAWQLLAIASTASAGDLLMFNGSEWVILAPGAEGTILKIDGGVPTWLAP